MDEESIFQIMNQAAEASLRKDMLTSGQQKELEALDRLVQLREEREIERRWRKKYPYPKVIAHRGASADAPENTLAAMALAWEQGADGVEIDIRITKDGHLVVLHDRNTGRTENKNKPKKCLDVSRCTLAELRKLDVGNENYPNQRIPTLEEVVASLPKGKELFIEIKSRDKRVIPELLRILENSKRSPDHFTIISFSRQQLDRLKKQAAHLKAYWLVGKQVGKRIFALNTEKEATPDFKQTFRQWVSGIVNLAQKDGFDGLDMDAGQEREKIGKDKLVLINDELMRQAREARLRLSIWTVDDAQRAKDLARLGVEAITTNCPAVIRRALKEDAGKRTGFLKLPAQKIVLNEVPKIKIRLPKSR